VIHKDYVWHKNKGDPHLKSSIRGVFVRSMQRVCTQYAKVLLFSKHTSTFTKNHDITKKHREFIIVETTSYENSYFWHVIISKTQTLYGLKTQLQNTLLFTGEFVCAWTDCTFLTALYKWKRWKYFVYKVLSQNEAESSTHDQIFKDKKNIERYGKGFQTS